MTYEKEEIELDGEKITIKKGALKRQLKVGPDYTFKIRELKKIQKVEKGETFDFHDKSFKMTPLMKSRVNLAITLMGKSKKKKDTHKMPDGTVMSGKTHSKDSKAVKN